jgi:hypothetical protein
LSLLLAFQQAQVYRKRNWYAAFFVCFQLWTSSPYVSLERFPL